MTHLLTSAERDAEIIKKIQLTNYSIVQAFLPARFRRIPKYRAMLKKYIKLIRQWRTK